VNKKSPIPIPIEPPFENIQSLKDLHFGCHFIKVFLKVLEQQRHLSPKKSQAKFCVISLKKRKKKFFIFRSYTSFNKNKNKTLPLTTILYYKS